MTRTIISVRDVAKEVEAYDDRLSKWAKNNRYFFQLPVAGEFAFVKEIFAVPHFRSLVRKQQILQGKPVSDPFVIAKAKVVEGCVVAEEHFKPHASQIPNICRHFGVECVDLEGFMEREDWTF
jgi:hypothetical protein